MIREEREKRKELIPYDVATDIFRRGLDVILRRLKRFPQEKAPSCNPQNPLHALGILEAGLIPSLTKPRANTQPRVKEIVATFHPHELRSRKGVGPTQPGAR